MIRRGEVTDIALIWEILRGLEICLRTTRDVLNNMLVSRNEVLVSLLFKKKRIDSLHASSFTTKVGTASHKTLRQELYASMTTPIIIYNLFTVVLSFPTSLFAGHFWSFASIQAAVS